MSKSSFFTIIICLLIVSSSLFAQSKEFVDFEVIGYHKLTLKDNVDIEEFKKAAKECIKAVNESFPGLSWKILKADRGPLKNQYVLFMVFDKESRRNYYYPTEESTGSAEFIAIWVKSNIQEKYQNLSQYLSSFELQADLIEIK